jgi:hypothetical protein
MSEAALNEDDLAEELNDALDAMDNDRPRNDKNWKPTQTSPVVSATNEDTVRATRTMGNQMDNIIAGLERDIKEADEIRLRVIRRIEDLKRARLACLAAKETLNGSSIS